MAFTVEFAINVTDRGRKIKVYNAMLREAIVQTPALIVDTGLMSSTKQHWQDDPHQCIACWVNEIGSQPVWLVPGGSEPPCLPW